MKKFTIILLILILITPALVQAGSISGGVSEFGQKIYGPDAASPQHPAQTIAFIIQGVLGVIGILFVVLITYSGFLYMTSGGVKEKIEKAKNYIVYSVLGLIIILLAYAITAFVSSVIINAQIGYN